MRKRIVLGISGGVSFVLFLILLAITAHMSASLPDQSMADRWSREGGVAQVSCFFSPNAGISEDAIKGFEYSVDKALQEASISAEDRNPGARLWADAYSAGGKVMVSSDKTTIEADVTGIGGDFFLFHPVKLISGSYFSGNDVNQDYCIIDRDAAWQLFGSNDVSKMMVMIGGVPHVVTGVVERETGRIAESAGLDGTHVYISYHSLKNYAASAGIDHYEIVMPNPVKNFALNHVRGQLGTNERETEILENTSRFSLLNRLKLITSFGTRSMNGKAILYPYWENIARGYEDIISLLTLFMIVFLLYPLMLGLVFFAIWWKHKGWTVKEVFLNRIDQIGRLIEKRRRHMSNRRRL